MGSEMTVFLLIVARELPSAGETPFLRASGEALGFPLRSSYLVAEVGNRLFELRLRKKMDGITHPPDEKVAVLPNR